MKVMLDTNVYDRIVETPGMTERLNELSAEGKLAILCTHVQEDELSRIRDPERRQQVFRIRTARVVTSGAVVGVSKVGLSSFGDCSSSGVSIGAVRRRFGRHAKDALIGATAAQHADVLVTEDRPFRNRMRSLGASCEVWDFEDLKEGVFQCRNEENACGLSDDTEVAGPRGMCASGCEGERPKR